MEYNRPIYKYMNAGSPSQWKKHYPAGTGGQAVKAIAIMLVIAVGLYIMTH